MYYGYGRVSSRDQARPDRVSLDEQTNRCRAVAQINNSSGFNFEMYVDRGVSGATPLYQRPEGQKMLAHVQKGDVIVASKLDRIFRSASDALSTIERWRRKGIDLVICDIGIEPISSSPAAKLFFGMMSLVAEFERNRIHERILEGKTAKKARGGHVGGLTPLGYRKEGQGRSAVLVRDETEQQHIVRARELRQLGYQIPYADIAEELAEEGIFGRDGKPYRPNAVWRMLKGRKYGEDLVQHG